MASKKTGRLFDPETAAAPPESARPLAARMRPRTPEDFVGQAHFFAPGKLLRRMLETDRLASLVFFGPPGTGKTALAHVIAGATKSDFREVNAVTSNVDEIRRIIAEARERLAAEGRRTLLFIDEIHRFNRAQQDALLPDVEKGNILLIGATTHNPYFAITTALLSRSQIFQFEALTDDNVSTIMDRAIADAERGLGNFKISLDDEARKHILRTAEGDARRALMALEIGCLSAKPGPDGMIHFDKALAAECTQRKVIRYDRSDDEHYDTASALIKSIRGSDPDAALYWAAKMIEGGEDPRFVMRRVVIAAAEDIGNADPRALTVAVSALQAVEFVGMPEAVIPMAQAITYLATAPKSNASYLAIAQAMKDVKEDKVQPVPKHLRGTGYTGAGKLGSGVGYQYAHDHAGHWVDQDYLSVDKLYYEPTDQGYEATIQERLERWRSQKSERPSPGK
ncbi:MAG: replication-associated recombination protein A [Planctomycetota bacterium]